MTEHYKIYKGRLLQNSFKNLMGGLLTFNGPVCLVKNNFQLISFLD